MELNSRYPELSLHIYFQNTSSYPVVEENGLLNLKILNTTFYQGKEEIKKWKESLPLNNLDVIYIYGLGLGHCYHALKLWLKQNPTKNIIFLEDDLSVIRTVFSLPKISRFLQDPQVHLKWIPSLKEEEVAENLAQTYPFEKMMVTALTLYQRKRKFKTLQNLLQTKTLFWASRAAENLFAPFLHANIIPNLRLLTCSSSINQWKGVFKGLPAIICGSGPSLQQSHRELKKLRNSALLMGCGSALSVLSFFNIRPHLGVALDPNLQEFEYLKNCRFSDLPLLYSGRLNAKALSLFQGPYGYLLSPSQSLFEMYVNEKLELPGPMLGTDLSCQALSVTTLAISLARFFGCNPIVLVGVDLSYGIRCGNTVYYSEGIEQRPLPEDLSSQIVYTTNFRGRKIKTLLKWMVEKAVLDLYAKTHPDTTLIQTYENSPFFHSISYQPLDEVFLKRKTVPFIIDEKISCLFHSTKLSVSSFSLDQIYEECYQSLHRCKTLLKQLLVSKEHTGDTVLYIDDLQQEIAFQILLEPSKRIFENIQKAQHQVSWQNLWLYLLEAVNSYQETFLSQIKKQTFQGL